jgi:acyl-CoA reductase-like NAD-dependent aldehyde dehydrogenase
VNTGRTEEKGGAHAQARTDRPNGGPASIQAPRQHGNFIDGAWTPTANGERYGVRNPARPDEVVGEFANSTPDDVAAAVTAASQAAPGWADTPGPQRGAMLFKFAQLLDDAREELGRIITLEQGKALGEAVGEVGRAAAEARFMAGEASRANGHTFPSERAGLTCSTAAEPIGVVAAICPWNFPVVTPVRKIAPALAYGNTVVCKPSSLTPWSAVFITELLAKAGVPAGVVNLVTGLGAVIGETLVADPRVAGITFTGSTAVGRRIYERAAARLARVQLELGGKNPAVVLDYDDLDGAAREIAAAAFLCSGQRCTAISRVIVLESQADALIERLLDHLGRIKVGDGLAPGTTMGPLVSEGQLERVDGFVKAGVADGCRLIAGGKVLTDRPAQEGYFYAPTMFDQVPADSPLALEEIFGPVLPVIRVRDLDEAIAIANGTRYGLAAALFARRLRDVHAFTRRVSSGMIHINHGTASQAHVPFGGVKESGQGAYSIGPTASEFYTNVKAIYVRW